MRPFTDAFDLPRALAIWGTLMPRARSSARRASSRGVQAE
jgi:hypothetical protein